MGRKVISGFVNHYDLFMPSRIYKSSHDLRQSKQMWSLPPNPPNLKCNNVFDTKTRNQEIILDYKNKILQVKFIK